MVATKVSAELWKVDWRVKWKGEIITDVFDMMRRGEATEDDVQIIFNACKDLEYLIKLSDDIPEEHWKMMITEVHDMLKDFNSIAAEYREFLKNNN